MEPDKEEFATHKQDLKGTGNPDPNSDLKRDVGQESAEGTSAAQAAGGTLDEKSDELSATEYVRELDQNKKGPDQNENSEKDQNPDLDQRPDRDLRNEEEGGSA